MKIKFIADILILIEKVIISSGILLIALITVANVISRTFFHYSFSFAEELSRLLMIAVTFVGVSYAVTMGRHIRMSAIYDLCSYRIRKLLMLFMTLSTAVMLGFLGIWAVDYISVLKTLESTTPALHLPLYIVYWICPIGLWLSAVKYLLTFIKNLTSDEIYLSTREKEHQHKVLP